MKKQRIMAGVIALVFVFSSAGLPADNRGSMVNITASAESSAHVWDGTADTSWYYREHKVIENETDSGTIRVAVFDISTPEELAGLAKLVRNGNSMENTIINLNADIALNDVSGFAHWDTKPPANNWIPIGEVRKNSPASHELFDYSTEMTCFSGAFNGNGHTISGMYCCHDNYAGLFGKVYRGSVLNLVVRDSYVLAESPQDKSWDTAAGGIAGACSESVIAYCDFDGKVTARGLTHMMNGSHMSCAGGIVGDFQDKDAEWLMAELVFMMFGFIVNPLLLTASQDTPIKAPGVYYCINRGAVYAQDGTDGFCNASGGIIGTGNHDLTIHSCLNLGDIGASHNSIGGIAGTAYNFPMSNCYYRGASKGLTLKAAGSTEDNAVNIETAGLSGQSLAEKLGGSFKYENGSVRLKMVDESKQDNGITYSEPETFKEKTDDVRASLSAPKVSYAMATLYGKTVEGSAVISWEVPQNVVICECSVFDDPGYTDLLIQGSDKKSIRIDDIENGRTYYIKVRGRTKSDKNDPECEYTEWANIEMCFLKMGDVNSDGVIDIEDAVCIIQNINGVTPLTKKEKERADVSGDTKIDIDDAVMIINYINGNSKF